MGIIPSVEAITEIIELTISSRACRVEREVRMAIASESGHWYDMDGNPCYTVIAKNGAPRNTTLRDARKLSLVPSVTTVMQVKSKPGLSSWIEQQILMSAYTAPYSRKELSGEEWIKRVKEDAKKQVSDAAEFGTRVHGAIELVLQGSTCDMDVAKFAEPAITLLSMEGLLYGASVEKSFCHTGMQYGGKVDFHNRKHNDFGIVVDFKTKAFTQADVDAKKQLAWDEHVAQLAAYREGLQIPNASCANIFISTVEPGLAVIKYWTEEECRYGWEVFEKSLALWKVVNKW